MPILYCRHQWETKFLFPWPNTHSTGLNFQLTMHSFLSFTFPIGLELIKGCVYIKSQASWISLQISLLILIIKLPDMLQPFYLISHPLQTHVHGDARSPKATEQNHHKYDAWRIPRRPEDQRGIPCPDTFPVNSKMAILVYLAVMRSFWF